MFAALSQNVRTWIYHRFFSDVGATQAVSPPAVFQAPAQLYPAVSLYLSRIPIPDRQQLLLYLYDANMYVEELTNRIVRAVLGKTGFTLSFKTPDTYTEGALRDFWDLNELLFLDNQEAVLRDYLVIGERCDVTAPCDGSFMLNPLPSQTFVQTVHDPNNYHKLIGVKQQVGMMDYAYHKIITQERTLSAQALALRKQWQYPCFLFQNLKKTAPIPAPGFVGGERLQKRGEPFLFTSSDLFKALVDYLWTSIDRIQALNTFNWGMKIKTDGTKEQKREAAEYWKKKIGPAPKPNSAFFYTDEIEPQAFAFPAGVATAVEGLFKLLRDTGGWMASARNEDMGDGDVKYASMRSPGVTNPSLETLVNIQVKNRQSYERLANYVLQQLYDARKVPHSEVDLGPGRRPKFRYSVLSPELSKQDMGQATAAFKTFEEAWEKVRAQGRFTPESLDTGEQQIIQELFGYDMEIQKQPETEEQTGDLPPEVITKMKR